MTLLLVGFLVVAGTYSSIFQKIVHMSPAFDMLLSPTTLSHEDDELMPLHIRERSEKYSTKLLNSTRPASYMYSVTSIRKQPMGSGGLLIPTTLLRTSGVGRALRALAQRTARA